MNKNLPFLAKLPLKHPFELLHNCQGPDNRLGNCVDIRDCDEYLKKLVSDPSQEIIGFVRISNEACKSHGFTTGQKVCCPIGRATVSDIPQAPPLLHRPQIQVPTQSPMQIPTQPPLQVATQPPQANSPSRVIPFDARSFPGCGIAKQTTFRRLIAGEKASAGTWPWIAAIGYYSNGGPEFNCAGTLVSDKHILTAAQCVTPDMSFVRLGALSIESDDGVNVPIEKGLLHGLYNPQTLQNDIAIIVLKEKVVFTDTVRPICLPISNELQEKDFTEYTPLTAGWKTNKNHANEKEGVLRQFQPTILSALECKSEFSDTFAVDDNFICAGNSNEKFQAGIGGSLMYPQVRIFFGF